MLYIAIAGIACYIEYYLLSHCRSNCYLRAAGPILAALLLAVFAGTRSGVVGTDTQFYAERAFLAADTSSLNLFFNYSDFSSWEPLSKLLFWGSAHLTNSFSFMLAAISLATFLPAMFGLQSMLGRYAPLGFFFYILMIYPLSLNLMRQSIAMGFIVLAIGFLLNKNYPLATVSAFVSVLFHKSAVVALLILPLYLLARKKIPLNVKLCSIFIAYLVFTLSFVFLGVHVAEILGYGAYFSGAADEPGGGETTLLAIVVVAVLVRLLFVRLRRSPSETSISRYHCIDDDIVNPLDETLSHLSYMLVLVGLLAFAYCLINFWFHRLGFFFLQFFPCAIVSAATHISGEGNRRSFVAISALILILLFTFYFIFQGANEVVPYVFSGWR